MNFKVKRNIFPAARLIQWMDVVTKINVEFQLQTQRIVPSGHPSPTIALHQPFFPGTFREAYQEVYRKEGITNLHTYLSFGVSSSLGNHVDNMDVLIVQAIGNMEYIINGTDKHILKPGDAMWIPAGTWHNPVPFEPRVSLSFSWD